MDGELNSLSSRILSAARRGDLAEMEKILSLGGLTVDSHDDDGNTAVATACAYGNLSMVKYLVAKGADYELCNNYGWTPMHHAHGHKDIIRFLVTELKVDPEMRNFLGCSALTLALRNGCSDVVAELFSSSTVDVKDSNVRVADMQLSHMMAAVMSGKIECCERLINSGADVSAAMDFTGLTPLMISAIFGRSKIAELLVKSGADITATNVVGQTAVDLARVHQHSDMEALLLKLSTRCSSQIDRAIADTNDTGANVMEALWEGNSDLVERLVASGSTLDFVEPTYHLTPLMVAAGLGYIRIVQVLLNRGARVNSTDVNGWTAVVMASVHEHHDIAELLFLHPHAFRKFPDSLAEREAGITKRMNAGSLVKSWAARLDTFPRLSALVKEKSSHSRSRSSSIPRRNPNDSQIHSKTAASRYLSRLKTTLAKCSRRKRHRSVDIESPEGNADRHYRLENVCDARGYSLGGKFESVGVSPFSWPPAASANQCSVADCSLHKLMACRHANDVGGSIGSPPTSFAARRAVEMGNGISPVSSSPSTVDHPPILIDSVPQAGSEVDLSTRVGKNVGLKREKKPPPLMGLGFEEPSVSSLNRQVVKRKGALSLSRLSPRPHSYHDDNVTPLALSGNSFLLRPGKAGARNSLQPDSFMASERSPAATLPLTPTRKATFAFSPSPLTSQLSRTSALRVSPHFNGNRDDSDGSITPTASMPSMANLQTDRQSFQRFSFHSTETPAGQTSSKGLHHLLQKLSLDRYLPVFEAQEIDVEEFFSLSDLDLKDLGIFDICSRNEILKAIREERHNHVQIQ